MVVLNNTPKISFTLECVVLLRLWYRQLDLLHSRLCRDARLYQIDAKVSVHMILNGLEYFASPSVQHNDWQKLRSARLWPTAHLLPHKQDRALTDTKATCDAIDASVNSLLCVGSDAKSNKW